MFFLAYASISVPPLKFDCHPPVGVYGHRIDNSQPELVVKFGERVQLLHLEHECANGIRLFLPCVLYAVQLLNPFFCLFVCSETAKALISSGFRA